MILSAAPLDYLQVFLLAMIVAYFAMKEAGDGREVNPILGFVGMILFMAGAAIVVFAVVVALALGLNWSLGFLGHQIW